MQLFAKDEKNCIIPAHQAVRKNNYYCLECSGLVKMRRGNIRRPHFFHIQLSSACKTSGKSLVHLQVQFAIQEMLLPENVTLEQRFASINRIADVCFERRKLIFEVQCSYITPSEILARNSDYKKIGYDVIWILHDKRYNQHFLSEAEEVLQGLTYYYTNIDCEKKGCIYDKIDEKKLPITLSSFYRVKNHCPFLPLAKRAFYFKGDVLDAFYENSLLTEDLQWLLQRYQSKHSLSLLKRLIRRARACYEALVSYFIEHACKG